MSCVWRYRGDREKRRGKKKLHKENDCKLSEQDLIIYANVKYLFNGISLCVSIVVSGKEISLNETWQFYRCAFHLTESQREN